MRATPERLLSDLGWLGLLFENLVVRDLRVYAQAVDADVFAYRDETGLEADAIVEMSGGRWAAFEVKLGQHGVDFAAEQLLRLRGRVDTDVAGEPIALVVVTATGYRPCSDVRQQDIHLASRRTLARRVGVHAPPVVSTTRWNPTGETAWPVSWDWQGLVQHAANYDRGLSSFASPR